jgi:hypothetical protein
MKPIDFRGTADRPIARISTRPNNEWLSIVKYLEGEKANINVKICVACGFARIYNERKEFLCKIERRQSLAEVKIIVEGIKQKNATIN